MAYVKGYTFDKEKIARELELADDDPDGWGKTLDAMYKTMEFIDRETNPICEGVLLGTMKREIVIITAEANDLENLQNAVPVEPRYLKKLAEHLLSGPHTLLRVEYYRRGEIAS